MSFFRSSGKISEHGKRAAWVPFFVFLLAVSFPDVVSWCDSVVYDVLFSFSPIIRDFAQQPEMPEHPVTIIYKDQTFTDRFGRDPDRSDFAELLSTLRKSGTDVAAFDFIYDQAQTEETDARFAEELASFTFPILATYFRTSDNTNRVFGAIPLLKELKNSAVDTALINMSRDFDSTIRFVPLAVKSPAANDLKLSLGFSAWLAHMISQKKSEILDISVNTGAAADKLFADVMRRAPHKFVTTGFKNLDSASLETENRFIKRLLALRFPELADEIQKYEPEKREVGSATWLYFGDKPLPIIGNEDMPCLRLFFTKGSPALMPGDGIPTKSMGMILETPADKASTLSDAKYTLLVDKNQYSQTISVLNSIIPAENCVLSGRVALPGGRPVKNAEILCLSPDAGTWNRAFSDENGEYCLKGINSGRYVIQAVFYTDSGWIKASAGGELAKEENKTLPAVIFPDCDRCVTVKMPAAATYSSEINIFGEPVILKTGSEIGQMTADKDLFEFSDLDSGETVDLSASEPFAADDSVIAAVPVDLDWKMQYFASAVAGAGADSCVIASVPTSLDSRIVLFNGVTRNREQKSSDFTILPNASEPLDSLPVPTRRSQKTVGLSFKSGRVCSVVLIDETLHKITGTTADRLKVNPGKYIVLLENGAERRLWLNMQDFADTVFVGTSLKTDQDFVVTPISFMDSIVAGYYKDGRSAARMPGVNLHAALYSALVRGSFMRAVWCHPDRMPGSTAILMQFLLFLPLMLAVNWIFTSKGIVRGAFCISALFVFWLALSLLLFLQQTMIPVVHPLLLLLGFGISKGYVAWAFSRQQESAARNTFGRFISAAVVNEILKNPEAVKTQSVKKELTVIFTDLAGFTTISEKLSPEDLTNLMNEYLGEMTKIVFQYGGTLDKYIGDAIMAFWNHPQVQADHAQRAVECNIAMQKKLAELREKWLKQGLPRVEVRGGVNSAVCMVGFIGSEIQMNFTCLGDGVNLASRMEGANKNYGTYVMISDSVLKQIDTVKISTRFLDYLAVKGKNEPVKVYEVRGYRNEDAPAWKEADLVYAHAHELYLSRKFAEAMKEFERVTELIPGDPPSKVYMGRCSEFMVNPPPEVWDGRYILKTK